MALIVYMVFLKVRVNGLQHRMAGLRYDGGLTISAVVIKNLA